MIINQQIDDINYAQFELRKFRKWDHLNKNEIFSLFRTPLPLSHVHVRVCEVPIR